MLSLQKNLTNQQTRNIRWFHCKSHFNACTCLYHWSEIENGTYLAVSLRGHAQRVLGNPRKTLQIDIKTLSNALEETFPELTKRNYIELRSEKKTKG